MHQAPSLERLLCKSKFMPVEEHFYVNSCGKNYVCCPYLFKASSYLFRRVNKVFFKKIILIPRAETLFMSLFLKDTKKNILARLAVW